MEPSFSLLIEMVLIVDNAIFDSPWKYLVNKKVSLFTFYTFLVE